MPWSEASSEGLLRIAAMRDPVIPSSNDNGIIPSALFDLHPYMVPADYIPTAVPVEQQNRDNEDFPVADPFGEASEFYIHQVRPSLASQPYPGQCLFNIYPSLKQCWTLCM